MILSGRAFLFGAVALILALDTSAQAAKVDMSGAWTLVGTPCGDVFKEMKGHWTFREPVDANGPSFIVEGNEIRGPEGSCRVELRDDREIVTLAADCQNSVSFASRTIELRPKGDGLIDRLNPEMGMTMTYKRCPR